MAKVWRSWVGALAGAWLAASAWVLGATGRAFVGLVVLGVLLMAAHVWTALDEPTSRTWRSWAAAVLGALLAVSPWALGFSSHGALLWSTFLVALVAGVAPSVWVALRPGTQGEQGSGGDASRDQRASA
jgi:hypothetical protein